ncbi:hypothetical protein [Prosthecobacter sp.]|uniref:hypothetical protein n=1 Tax=Prosthecobacter sp. TaxID=1965333 RepID=UPI00378391D5
MIFAITAYQALPSGFAILIIAVAIFCYWLAIRRHKSAIRAELTKFKVELIKIRWIPFEGGRHDTVYEVTLVLPSGKQVSAICKCNLWQRVDWKSPPWAENLRREPAPEQ